MQSGKRNTEIRRLEIEVTKRCPLNCMHCSVSAVPDVSSSELTIDEIKNVIGEFWQLGGKEVVITGGEPLARGKEFILKIVEEAESHGLSTFIYTSGFLFDAHLAKTLRSKSVTICISIEGTERIHDSIVGVKGSYKRAVDALKVCRQNKIQTIVNFTPMKNNYQYFLHILDVAKEFNAQTIKVFNFSAQGRGFDNRNCLKLSPKEQIEIIDEIKKVLKEKKIPIDFGGEFQGLNTKCSVGKKIVITFDGDVLPCLGLRSNPLFVIGNCRKETLPELIEKLEKIRSDTCLCSSTKNNISNR